VVLAAEGYPGPVRKGDAISGLDATLPATRVFHAATAERGGAVVTAGGRVLCVTALGGSVAEAQARAYARVEAIRWAGMHYRRDIGYRAVARERALTR
jgi:phosphoribosylamine--glycine ligase